MMEKSGMKDIHDFYVEVSNLTSIMIRHYAMVNVSVFVLFLLVLGYRIQFTDGDHLQHLVNA